MADLHPVRTIHLFSDQKFIPWVKRTFGTTGWTSTYIILNPRIRSSSKAIDADTFEMSADTFGQARVLEKMNEAEIAFHYFLDNIKAELILSSPPGVLHCWCFYGAEIYQQTNLFRKDIYGPATKKLLWTLPEIKFRYDLRKYYYILRHLKKPPMASLLQAIPRIHCMLWYVEEEIKMLRQRIQLPPWQFFQFFSFEDIIPPGTPDTNRQSRRILIGNSATVENNHLDVLTVLRQSDIDTYTFSLPMTYGLFPRYKAKIRKRYEKALGERVFFLEDHLKLREYYEFLQQHPTAIFLHYRQQALGNILYLLYTGTKVYLSRHNIIFQWLTRNQIKVYTFEEQFETDYTHHDLVLDDHTIVQNKKGIITLLDHDRNLATLHALEAEVRNNREKVTA